MEEISSAKNTYGIGGKEKWSLYMIIYKIREEKKLKR